MKKGSIYIDLPGTQLFPLIFLLAIFAANLSAEDAESGTVLFFGDSLTAGYEIGPDKAYPALLEDRMREEGLPYGTVNAGLSGETTAGGLRRIDWVLRREIDVFVLALGGNDALRGFDPEETRSNLRGILEKVHERYPDARLLLAGMQAPPNMGSEYTDTFAAIYPKLAEELDIPLVPFLLEGMALDPEYNLDDLIHPNERGHRVIADNVWEHLEPLLRN